MCELFAIGEGDLDHEREGTSKAEAERDEQRGAKPQLSKQRREQQQVGSRRGDVGPHASAEFEAKAVGTAHQPAAKDLSRDLAARFR